MSAKSGLKLSSKKSYKHTYKDTYNETNIKRVKIEKNTIELAWVTILGDINPEDLGRTLPHEHLEMNFDHFYRKPPTYIADKFGILHVTNMGFIRQYPYSCRHNLTLKDNNSSKAVMKDLHLYKKYGGGSIVENSTYGLERNVDSYYDMSQQTGVHIVAGTGFYIADMQSPDHLHAHKEEIYNIMLNELTEGCIKSSHIKAGFMGEIASVWPITDFERRVIKVVGELQQQVGCGVSFHPHRDPAAPFEIMRLYAEAGGRVDKAVMSHLDRTFLDVEKLKEFAELGSYCQFDLFGTEVSYYQLSSNIDMPSDAQRLELIRHLVDEGKSDRVLMSHDIHTKHRLTEYGGHGYSHIINNILPRMKQKGFSNQIIDEITISNPANWLAMPA